MSDILTVSEYIEIVNETLVATMQPGSFEIEGEVSSFGISGGQWVRFDLKDGDAVVNCFLTAWQLKEQIEDGMRIAVTGYGKLYPKYGKFSFVVQSIRLSGEGSLRRAFEMLQKKLQHEGLFAVERKRVFPRFPMRVALITSREAAAYTDFLRVAGARWPAAEIIHCNVGVQGKQAPAEVIAALEDAGSRPGEFDAIVLTRGGGSLEDLHVFNMEEVARAIYGSLVPVICGVGHERDVTIADMVADVRAATPSNAAELLFPDSVSVIAEIQHLVGEQEHKIMARIAGEQTRIQRVTFVVDRWLSSLKEHLSGQGHALAMQGNVIEQRISRAKEAVVSSVRLLESLHPHRILKRGYSYTKAADGSIIGAAHELASGQAVTQVYFDGEAQMIVRDI